MKPAVNVGKKKKSGQSVTCAKLKCSCEHEIQDEMYGKGIRLFNPCKFGAGWRCTVCGKERHEGQKDQSEVSRDGRSR